MSEIDVRLGCAALSASRWRGPPPAPPGVISCQKKRLDVYALNGFRVHQRRVRGAKTHRAHPLRAKACRLPGIGTGATASRVGYSGLEP
jgi:hypothetical protein